MWDGYIQDFEKVKSKRSYIACCGRSSSWIWADRVNAQRWGRNKCGTPWPTTGASWMQSRSPSKKVRRPRGKDRAQVDPLRQH